MSILEGFFFFFMEISNSFVENGLSRPMRPYVSGDALAEVGNTLTPMERVFKRGRGT